MANVLPFARKSAAPAAPALAEFMRDFSIEVMPRTAAKVADFRGILPGNTRVYVAHVDGTDFAEMLGTARRLVGEGFRVMPHFPARGIESRTELERRIAAYAEAGVREALVIGGGIDTPRGAYSDSLQLLKTGLFDAWGFTDLHIAGHPEGNRDIDPGGGDGIAMSALHAKAAFAGNTDARMAIATQFGFEAAPIIAWAERLRASGITLPVHVGVAGPAKLQTLIKYAMACGVGASLRVLQRRAMDLTRLMTPFEPTELIAGFAAHRAACADSLIEAVHFFPLGGIAATAEYTAGAVPRPLRARA